MEPYGLTHCARLTRHVTESICLSAIHLHPKIRLGSDVTRHALRAQGQEGVEGSRHTRVQRFAQIWPRDRWPINTQRRGCFVASRLDIAAVAVLGVLKHPLGHLGIKMNCLWYFWSLIIFSFFFSFFFLAFPFINPPHLHISTSPMSDFCLYPSPASSRIEKHSVSMGMYIAVLLLCCINEWILFIFSVTWRECEPEENERPVVALSLKKRKKICSCWWVRILRH